MSKVEYKRLNVVAGVDSVSKDFEVKYKGENVSGIITKMSLDLVSIRNSPCSEIELELFKMSETVTNDNWKHRSSGMVCKTCMWYQKKESNGRCKKHCPTLNGFPVVFETDWCGDHKLN